MYKYLRCKECDNLIPYKKGDETCSTCGNTMDYLESKIELDENWFIGEMAVAYYAPMASKPQTPPNYSNIEVNNIYDKEGNLDSIYVNENVNGKDFIYGLTFNENALKMDPIDDSYVSYLNKLKEGFTYETFKIPVKNNKVLYENLNQVSRQSTKLNDELVVGFGSINKIKEHSLTSSLIKVLEAYDVKVIDGSIDNYKMNVDYLKTSPLFVDYQVGDITDKFENMFDLCMNILERHIDQIEINDELSLLVYIYDLLVTMDNDFTKPYTFKEVVETITYNDKLNTDRININILNLIVVNLLSKFNSTVILSNSFLIEKTEERSVSFKGLYSVPTFWIGNEFYIIDLLADGPINKFIDPKDINSVIKEYFNLEKEDALVKTVNLKASSITGLDINEIETLSFNRDEELFAKYILKLSSSSKEVYNESLLNEEASSINKKRKKIESKILKIMDTMDVTGKNTAKYREIYRSMTDEQFISYMKKFANGKENFYLEVLPNVNEPTMKQIQDSLDILGVPENEYVYYRHDGHKDNPIRTRYRVPVGYVTIKRMQQLLSKKNTYSLSISKRSPRTNQVSGTDKIAKQILVIENSLNCWKLFRA